MLTRLLDHSQRPIYVVDAERRIVYCNSALAAWLDLEPNRILDRIVEYHSEPARGADTERSGEIPLAELCPPPRALAGERCEGTISCLARGGSMVHRQAEFVPLDLPGSTASGAASRRRRAGAVLVLLAGSDLGPEELRSAISGDPPADELHRTIRQFRRTQAAAYSVESLIGASGAMRKVRAQVAAAAASGANCLVCGPRGSGRRHIARAIHYGTGLNATTKLIPVDCVVANDDLLRRAVDSASSQHQDGRHRSTLLLENLEALSESHQSQLLSRIQRNALAARLVATFCSGSPGRIDPALQDALSTITIHVPPLAERLEDLPLLAQCFLETCNRGSIKQIGSLRQEALDLFALYSWPGELDELRAVVEAAHRACGAHEITPADLPPIIHHASQAASRSPRRTERIVLDDLLAAVEKEAIARAMTQARGNKTEAAELLGMTRPRLYRRLVQLGLVTEPVFEEVESPEFIEQDPTESAP
jgi:DNA-binding NtrC family response regulator